MKRISLLLILIAIVSCKSVQVNQLAQRTTLTVVELGTIGSETKKLETTVFQTSTVPSYKEKLRLAVSIVPFNDKTFNAYAQAAQQQNQDIKITYIDSVENKPGYASLKLLDKVQLLEELNAAHNKGTNAFLQNSNNSKIVTSIAAYSNSVDLNSIGQAEEVYLVNNKPQKYTLELVKNGKSFMTIDISRAVPFAYTTASFCWKKDRGVISIANIIEGNQTCARGTYRNVARLEKSQNLFKY